MKYNRMLGQAEKNGVDLRTLPPPPKSEADPTLKPCPYCGRKFGEKQAERHVPVCKNTLNKPAPPKIKSPRSKSRSRRGY